MQLPLGTSCVFHLIKSDGLNDPLIGIFKYIKIKNILYNIV